MLSRKYYVPRMEYSSINNRRKAQKQQGKTCEAVRAGKNKVVKMRKLTMSFFAIVLMGTGVFMLFHSSSLEKYSNEQEYRNKYQELIYSENKSTEFYKLRSDYLTAKFKLEDYGLTLILTSIPLLLIFIIGIENLKTPSKKIWLVIIGILAALTTNIGYVGDLFLEYNRESYPHWADSLLIPLMGVPFSIMMCLGWVALLIGITSDLKTNILIFPFKIKTLNYWYLGIWLLTIILTITVIIEGHFWQVLSGFLWVYFHTSILVGSKKTKI